MSYTYVRIYFYSGIPIESGREYTFKKNRQIPQKRVLTGSAETNFFDVVPHLPRTSGDHWWDVYDGELFVGSCSVQSDSLDGELRSTIKR